VTPVHATPLVRRTAERLGVDLTAVCGTGKGGRIRVQDVSAAAGRVQVATSTPAARPSLVIEQRSMWTRENRFVSIDVFAANPVLDDLRQVDPARLAAAQERNGPPPTLFQTGDLPLATASGIDPQLLTGVPYVARHALMNASAADAVAILEQFGAATPDAWETALLAHCLDQGVLSYEHRLQAWAAEWA
jgi:hypothetical protein